MQHTASTEMILLRTAAEARGHGDTLRQAGRTIAFVPTMGALHQGHMALVDEGRRLCDTVVLSIFVNPTQFNVRADFDAYPRTLDSDLEIASGHGVDAVYVPTAEDMYPVGFDTTVHVDRTASPLEGAGRPGHFDGVATVVTKLFNAVRPDVAVFGQKDYQQLAVIRRMAADLDTGIRIVGLPTVREADGLAMSSRNVRLSPQERAVAPVIHEALSDARAALESGDNLASSLRDVFSRRIETEPLARLEYVSVADAGSLRELEVVDTPAVMSCAVWFGDVRLIDNILLPC